MAIDEYRNWTPIELRHAIMECSVDDVNSALSGVAALCSIINTLQARIEKLESVHAGTGGIVGKMFFVEAEGFEGLAEVLSVNNDDTVNIRSDYNGAIHVVSKDDLSEWIPESATYQETARACFFLKEDPWGAGAANNRLHATEYGA